MSKPVIEWMGPWADAKYRKKHLRKPVKFAVCTKQNHGWWFSEENITSLKEAKKSAQRHITTCVLAYSREMPPTTIAIVYPGGE